jgi:hypothetical protein
MLQISVLTIVWFTQGVLNCPPITEPCPQSLYWNVQLFRPFDQKQPFPSKGVSDSSCCIPHLLPTSCPTAVRRTVSFAILNAVKRMQGSRFSSHVGQKVFVSSPPFTYRNSSTTIPSVSTAAPSQTPVKHCCPRPVLRRSVLSAFAMRAIAASPLLKFDFWVYTRPSHETRAFHTNRVLWKGGVTVAPATLPAFYHESDIRTRPAVVRFFPES